MTPRLRSYGTAFSCGQIETPPTQLNLFRIQFQQSFRRLKDSHLSWFRLFALVLLAAALVGCHQSHDQSRHVELVMGSSTPTPDTTFELRFDSVMVKSEQVGLTAINSPLLIEPRLRGTFTWLSTRSGVFTPSEPLRLDTRYQLTLRPDLRCANGQLSDATLHSSVTTPAFRVIGQNPHRFETNACSEPDVTLFFNADVRARDAQGLLYFADNSGHHVPADVQQGTVDDTAELWGLQTWQQEAAGVSRFKDQVGAASEVPTNEVPWLLVAMPRTPLPLGDGWKLVVPGGILSSGHSLPTREKLEVPIGNVTPFAVREAVACNYLNAGPSIRVSFSKPIPESLTNTFRDWLDVKPAPANLAVEVLQQRLVVTGNFQGGADYTPRLRPGFKSAEPFTLEGSNTFMLSMPHVAPRIYFSALSRDQFASGNRTFPLLSINVARVRLRAKLMDPQTAIHALRGFSSYFANQRGVTYDWDEPFHAIDYNLLPGQTVFEKQLALGVDAAYSDTAAKTNLNWDELLNGRHAGVVFLDAQRVEDSSQSIPLGSQALIQLTDLGMVWKTSPAGVDVFVFSQKTGEPVGGAKAFLFGNENESLRDTTTDTNGLAHLNANTNAKWIAVEHEQDFHALPLDASRVWNYRFNLPFTGSSYEENPRLALMFSDRDLYRPRESVHLEMMVRDWADARLTVPAGLSGTLKCLDAQGKRFFETNVSFSALGSSSTLVPLPAAPCGFYSARLHVGSNAYTYAFQVQDFQPNAFEIALPSKDAYGAGEPIELPLSSHYLFGKKLSRAQVSWSAEAADTDFQSTNFPGFTFRRDDFEAHYGRGQSSLSLNGRGVLTNGSNFVIPPKLSVNPAAPQPRAVSLLAEVTDVNQQTLSRRVEFLWHSSDFYLGLRRGSDVWMEGTNVPLEAVAVSADGSPWAEPVKAQLRLQRVDWQSVRVQGSGRTVRFHNEAVFSNIVEQEISIAPLAAPEKSAEAKGNPIAGLPPLSAGEYLLELKTEDSHGRAIASSLDFQVAAPGEVGRNYRNDVQLALKTDHETYAPGDVAEILIEAPFSGTALVSVEREKVLRSFVTHLEGNAPAIRIPLQADDVPNVFVSVTLTRGAESSPHKNKEPEYRVGCCELRVMDPQNRLQVKIAPAATNCLPGAPMEVAVAVTDSAERPVAGTEVVLYAVDDGILGLTDYTLPDPYKFFYASRSLGVQSSVSIPNLLSEDPDELSFQNKGYLGGGGGRDRIRKNFLACAFWSASLVTDADGKVNANFIAPDSLTRYRLLAVAHTAESQFGNSQSAFRVSKPLMIEPSLPAFASITDHLTARAVIHNQTRKAGEVIVSLELDDKVKTGGTDTNLSRRISIPADGSVPVEFPVEFVDTGDTRWVWKARFAEATAGNYRDAVQSTMTIGHIAPMLGEVLLTRATNSDTDLLVGANPQLLGGSGIITVSVSNTRLNELGETVLQLLHYPYGCAEQTGSSLLPWILWRDAPGLLPTHQLNTNDSAAAIRAGIERFFSMQTASGGFGYWPHARKPMLWASAYGGMVLALAQRHGVAVSKEPFDSLLTYLSRQLRSGEDGQGDLSDKCLAAYALALAGRPEPGYHEKLYSVRGKLSPENRALLALAIAESHGPQQMIAELLQTKAPMATDYNERFGCFAREDAIRLLAWTLYRPEDPTVDRLVDDLMRNQKNAHWGTTQGNAWALLALTEYARLVELKLAAADGRLNDAGQSFPFHLDERTNVFVHTFAFTNRAEAALRLLKQSTNRLYTTVSIEARPPETPQPCQDRGFSLQRRYDRLDDDNQSRGLDGLQVGDRVVVSLKLIVREPARYMVIDDPLPAVLEAINPEFRTQQARSADVVSDDGDWWFSDFHEIRKDRCLSFANEVRPGTYTFRYLARVRAAGSVTAPSAKAEEMYHPERCGLSESQTLVSKGLDE
jgi:alpha-2-macroglobulin